MERPSFRKSNNAGAEQASQSQWVWCKISAVIQHQLPLRTESGSGESVLEPNLHLSIINYSGETGSKYDQTYSDMTRPKGEEERNIIQLLVDKEKEPRLMTFPKTEDREQHQDYAIEVKIVLKDATHAYFIKTKYLVCPGPGERDPETRFRRPCGKQLFPENAKLPPCIEACPDHELL